MKIAYLITGQARSFYNVIDTWKKYAFPYGGDLYMSLDCSISVAEVNAKLAEVNATIKYFEVTEQQDNTDYVEYYSRMRQIDHLGYDNHIDKTYQYYRMYRAYQAMIGRIAGSLGRTEGSTAREQSSLERTEGSTAQEQSFLERTSGSLGIKYDYIVRIRPDSYFVQDLKIIFDMLENNYKTVVAEHEQVVVCKAKYGKIFELVKYFGNYTEDVAIKASIYRFLSPNKTIVFNNTNMMFAPEKQFIDHLIHVVMETEGLQSYEEFSELFLGITYPSFQGLLREDGSFAYVGNDWKPYEVFTPM
jgi:hypothetical protein